MSQRVRNTAGIPVCRTRSKHVGSRVPRVWLILRCLNPERIWLACLFGTNFCFIRVRFQKLRLSLRIPKPCQVIFTQITCIAPKCLGVFHMCQDIYISIVKPPHSFSCNLYHLTLRQLNLCSSIHILPVYLCEHVCT